MKTQITSCPHCGNTLLNDMAECHSCGHVLDNEAALRLKSRQLPSDKAVNSEMESCPNCGEECRTGLVRCWNCSAFLRPEIEASYRKMRQAGRYEAERVELPIIDASHISEQDSVQRRVNTPESFLASNSYSSSSNTGDDDFELADNSMFDQEDDDAFELNDNLFVTDGANQSATDDSADVFSLQMPLAASQATPSSSGIEEPVPVPEALESVAAPETLAAPETVAEQTPTAEAPVASVEEDLLKIAADEEKDIQRVRKSLRSKDTFVIFCPQGCRIRVKEQHRGKTGKCPRCQSEFVVPKKQAPKPAATGEQAPPQVLESRFKKWLPDIRLHTVDPLKLRIKADSLLNECQAVDLGFATDGLLLANLVAGKFGANPKKVAPLRQTLIDHFQNQGAVETLNVPLKRMYSRELLAAISLAQPTTPGSESLFADIPVFGTNRIAVRLPKLSDDPHPRYLSFNLSEFRSFVEGLESICGLTGLAANAPIPMQDEYETLKCHVKSTKILSLKNLSHYEKDPGFKLEIAGWKCAKCGIVISEAARAETKLGGANGKAIAKAKCPKCSGKFGSVPVYQLVVVPSSEDKGSATDAAQEAPAS